MAQRVVLHIGAMKSGTSYIQDRLLANQEQLRAQGVLFPGRTWRDQVLAVSDVLEHNRVGPVSHEGRWEWLKNEAASWPGTLVVSMEFLGPAEPRKIRKVVEGFPGASVEVVLTARDLNRNIPAMWQETVQNYHTWTWEEYVRAVRLGPHAGGGAGKNFWRQQDVPRIARFWADVVGRENLTVVTVPPPGAGPEVLWERFCSVAGIDAGSCAPIPRSNEALGAASALAMRRLNVLLREQGMPWKDYSVLVKFGLAKKGLAARKSEEPVLGFPVRRWVRRRSRKMITQLQQLGVPVVGDLSDLKPVAVAGTDPKSVSEAEQLEAALAGLREVLVLWSEDRQRQRPRKRRR